VAKVKEYKNISGRLSASEMLKVSKRALASAKRNKLGKTEVTRREKLVTKYKKLSPEAMKMYKELSPKRYAPSKSRQTIKQPMKTAIRKVSKASIAKRVLGKTLSKAIPGAGAAIIARDVVKGISKATCSKRGGKWVSGKCSGARKTKLKAGSKVRDPISKR
tara:strand:+ start:51 stop:536 length:486 start_codon:yes stop_codon:yes gene_type:complete